ncbi:MAG: hypothetical protein JNM71_12630 [Flavobacterium lindanitolerans]|uniref:hypothetical protein n=1 Tax=Flavobacterium lindanitolerans TaxID=428988 RepID=UPI001A459EA5|nr:hypothetical protein [Flavobacterium lindanitolerans]MBL7868852.1 hypothetical protein [Flavobacterium lindanitolerans]
MRTTVNFRYDFGKKNLLLISSTGRPILSVTGDNAKRMYKRMTEQNRTLKEMTAADLEAKIFNLNEWLYANEGDKEYKKTEFARDYYVNKLIELEENKLKTIRA